PPVTPVSPHHATSFFLLSFSSSPAPRYLHSFPTRRSSDLLRALLPALLALPESADLPGGVLLVRQSHRVQGPDGRTQRADQLGADRKSTRLNSSHVSISYAVFCLKKKKRSMLILHSAHVDT